MTGRDVKTTCPYCGVGCGVLVRRDEQGSVDIKGDPEHPANYGRLCSKGTALGDTLSLDDRLLYPEINGNQSSWDTALDTVANAFSSAIKTHGTDSVAFYVSGQILTEDYYVANKLVKGFIGSANIDTNSRLCMASSVAGHRKAFGTDTVPGCYEDLELADLVVLVGSNLAWCHPVVYQRIVAAKQKRPSMKIVLIDPRRTMTSKLADIHLAIESDGDVALFSALLAYLCETGAVDQDYVDKHTSGFDEAVSQACRLSKEEVQHQTGLTQRELVTFFELFRDCDKVVTLCSQGVNQSVCGTDKVSAIINCHLATGRIGRPGMGPFSITGQPNAMGGREVGGLANMLAAHMDIENPEHRALVQEFWNSPTIAEKQGLKAVDLFKAVADRKIKALWIMATNPVDSMPDANNVRAAIKACPFVVVSDVIRETDTSCLAHVKLPSLAWGEKDGSVTNSERRISRQRSFLPPPGDAKADWWQLAEVARRMGFEEAFNYRASAEIFREFAALSTFRNEGSRDFDIGAVSSISSAAYRDMKPFQWPQTSNQGPRETRFFANGRFYTPDRKGRFIAVSPTPKATRSNKAAFVLNTGRIRDQWHTMTRTAKSPQLASHLAEPFCELHPQDAEDLGMKDADLLKITNEHGEIVVRALISDSQKQGYLFVPIHWTDQFAANARVDTLVPPVTDPFSGQPALKDAIVNVSLFHPAYFGFLVSKERPTLVGFPYWALAKCEGGWRAEFALSEGDVDILNLAETILPSTKDQCVHSYMDKARKQTRAVWFANDHLSAAIYLSDQPVNVSRSLVAGWLYENDVNPAMSEKIIAGLPTKDVPDKGAIVCSCFQIGVNEIANAALNGCHTVNDIGVRLKAGANCGSCRSEIEELLQKHTIIAAE